MVIHNKKLTAPGQCVAASAPVLVKVLFAARLIARTFTGRLLSVGQRHQMRRVYP